MVPGVKIAITHPYAWPEVRRGAERIVVEISRALALRGHDVVVYTAGSDAGRTESDGVTTVKFRRRFDRASLHERWFGSQVAAKLATGGFDATHSFMPFDALGAIRTRRIGGHRTLYHEMGVPFLIWDRLHDRRARMKVAELVDVYGCMSQYALDALHANVDRTGVRVPGGVRLSQFEPTTEREPTPTVLFSGAFDLPWKGVASLLRAVAIASETEPDLQLWLSGPGNGEKLLAEAPEAARQRVTILPLGEPDDQPDRYRRAWVTAQPSVQESFGMVMLESLASGTPIVTTDDGALQELVTEGTGVVSVAGDDRSLADALVAAVELARDPATVAACRASAAPYDWEDGMVPLLEGLFSGGGR